MAIDAGCALAQAPLVARMDADDVMLPDRLERQAAYLDAHPEVALLGGGSCSSTRKAAKSTVSPAGRSSTSSFATSSRTRR